MTITFANIPTTIRTPGAYAEIDNSRALKGLVQNPHKVLILGQKTAAGTVGKAVLTAITRDNLADGYFGPGSILARMCNRFKANNPNTELYAMALSGGTATASARLHFSVALSATAGIVSGVATVYMMINGEQLTLTLNSGWSVTDVNSYTKALINASTYSNLPVVASMSATSTVLMLSAVCSGAAGNYLDVRFNYYDGQSYPKAFGDSVLMSAFAGGANAPDLGDAWAVIAGEQFHHIIQPYVDAANLTEIEDELASRFLPLDDLWGHGYTAVRGTAASCTTLGNGRNSPHNTIIGFYDSPTDPAEWAAALGAVAAWNLNNDPGRPLQFLHLKGLLPPPVSSRFDRSERDILLYDGIATYMVDTGGRVLLERCITTYQSNALGLPDPSYLDVEVLATLAEIRYQYRVRMTNRFITQRFKLADDTFPVQPGSKVVTPRTIKEETIALFTILQDKGLIENLQDFIDNLVVERDAADRNRVNVLLPPDLVNQFRILAAIVEFIL
jgi:phage tail sheath gpL-like